MDGVRLANTKDWKNRDLAKSFLAILKSQTDDVILTPMAGGKPVWSHKWYGRLMTQYLSHMFESTGVVLLSDLTRREARLLHGALMSVALGGMVYVIKQHTLGRPEKIAWDNPAKFLFHAFDRSGLLGVLGEINSKFENLSGGRLSVQALGGFPTNSYHYRTPFSVLGPTAGLGEDLVKLFSEIAEPGHIGATTVGRSKRMIVGQNLWYLSPAATAMEKGIKKWVTQRRRLFNKEQKDKDRYENDAEIAAGFGTTVTQLRLYRDTLRDINFGLDIEF